VSIDKEINFTLQSEDQGVVVLSWVPEKSLSTDKLIVSVIAVSLALLSWVVVTTGPSMPMSGVVDSISLLLFVGVWAIGMMAMMLPSLLPMIFMVIAAARQNSDGTGLALAQKAIQPVQFVLGYFGIWSSVGLVSYFALVILFRFYPPFSSLGQLAGIAAGLAVFLAGVYQLSPLKQRALEACRSPMNFVMNRWKVGKFGGFFMGFDYGFFCTKCCWAFMAVLVVVGAMNLLWMILFAGVIFVEKIAPHGIGVSKALGIILMAAGVVFAAT
jgi:predicted metal-binding membrane protein